MVKMGEKIKIWRGRGASRWAPQRDFATFTPNLKGLQPKLIAPSILLFHPPFLQDKMVLSSSEEKYIQLHHIPLHQSTPTSLPLSSIRQRLTLILKCFIIFSFALLLPNLKYFKSFLQTSQSTFSSSPLPIELSSHTSIRWLDCSDEAHPHFVCSYINVPKDYTNASAGIASIALSKLPATSKAQDKLGSIWLNPGGPGELNSKLRSSSNPPSARYPMLNSEPP